MKKYTFQEKLALVRLAKPGDTWVNVKTKRTATITRIDGYYLELQHQNGWVSRKQDHYFAGDFEPMAPEAVSTTGSVPVGDNFDYCAGVLQASRAAVRVMRQNGYIIIRIRPDLRVDFTPSPEKRGGGVWKIHGASQNRGFGLKNLGAYIAAHIT